MTTHKPESEKAIRPLPEIPARSFRTKGLLLSEVDFLLSKKMGLRDDNGQFRAFVPENVVISFEGCDDLQKRYGALCLAPQPDDREGMREDKLKAWQAFIDDVVKWTKEAGHKYERRKALAAVLWQYATATHDDARFWNQSGVEIEK